MKSGFVWAMIFFLFGCAQLQELTNPRTASQDQKIEQLTAQLRDYQKQNQALKAENRKLKAYNLRLKKSNNTLLKDNQKLLAANSKLETDNRDLALKINMLKILDHRVEEKRKSYIMD